MMVDCYFRPSEAVDLLCEQVLGPHSSQGIHRTAIHLNPDYRGKPGKTGELDEALLVNRSWLSDALWSWARARKAAGELKLWDFTLVELRNVFILAATAVGIEKFKPVLYMGRHTGASLDRLNNTLSLQAVQQRGRWRTASSVRRYEKHALIQDVLDKMSVAHRKMCERAAAALEALVARHFP